MLHFNNEEERLEHIRMLNRKRQARYYKKHKKKVFEKQKEKRHKAIKETYGHDDLRGNILTKIYHHPNNTYTKTELQRMKKKDLLLLLNRLDGDLNDN